MRCRPKRTQIQKEGIGFCGWVCGCVRPPAGGRVRIRRQGDAARGPAPRADLRSALGQISRGGKKKNANKKLKARAERRADRSVENESAKRTIAIGDGQEESSNGPPPSPRRINDGMWGVEMVELRAFSRFGRARASRSRRRAVPRGRERIEEKRDPDPPRAPCARGDET